MPEKVLPARRLGATYEVVIMTATGRIKLYVRTGLYEDGSLGEIFVDIAKFGSDLRSTFSCWAIIFSIALQNGVPLERLVRTFEGVSFEPKGKVETSVKGIEQCSSVPDVVCRILRAEFLDSK